MKKFLVTYTAHIRASDVIEAESKEEADKIIDERTECEDFMILPDHIDDIDYDITEMK